MEEAVNTSGSLTLANSVFFFTREIRKSVKRLVRMVITHVGKLAVEIDLRVILHSLKISTGRVSGLFADNPRSE